MMSELPILEIGLDDVLVFGILTHSSIYFPTSLKNLNPMQMDFRFYISRNSIRYFFFEMQYFSFEEKVCTFSQTSFKM